MLGKIKTLASALGLYSPSTNPVATHPVYSQGVTPLPYNAPVQSIQPTKPIPKFDDEASRELSDLIGLQQSDRDFFEQIRDKIGQGCWQIDDHNVNHRAKVYAERQRVFVQPLIRMIRARGQYEGAENAIKLLSQLNVAYAEVPVLWNDVRLGACSLNKFGLALGSIVDTAEELRNYV